MYTAESIWLEIWGSWIRIKKIDFSRQISEKVRFFHSISQKHFDFSRQIYEKFRFFQAIDFPGKSWPFTATTGQIILYLFKSYHFRTYFLYMIRYMYNISRLVHDPPAQNLGVAISQPQD